VVQCVAVCCTLHSAHYILLCADMYNMPHVCCRVMSHVHESCHMCMSHVTCDAKKEDDETCRMYVAACVAVLCASVEARMHETCRRPHTEEIGLRIITTARNSNEFS